jgi:RNA polymerase sigma-70 factor (ECF subfamily)
VFNRQCNYADLSNLYDEHYSYIVSCCIRYVDRYDEGIQSLVEDAVQNAFMKAIDKYDDFLGHPNKLGWLITVSKNELKNISSKDRRHRRINAMICDSQNMKNQDDPITYVIEQEKTYELQEIIGEIRKVITQSETEVFTEYFLKNHTTQESAENIGVTKSAIKNAVYRIRNKAKSVLKALFDKK